MRNCTMQTRTSTQDSRVHYQFWQFWSLVTWRRQTQEQRLIALASEHRRDGRNRRRCILHSALGGLASDPRRSLHCPRSKDRARRTSPLKDIKAIPRLPVPILTLLSQHSYPCHSSSPNLIPQLRRDAKLDHDPLYCSLHGH